MRQILPPIVLAQKILGQQKTDERAPHRMTAHCMRLEQPGGVLLYHTLTGELLLLDDKEAALLRELPGNVPTALAGLVPRRFLVPEGTDDMAAADRTRQTARFLEQKNRDITEYLIFTTTACNARCFYCFEAGIKKAVMSEETARAAGEYIAAHCGGKPVNLVWFGGEPLLNIPAIDTISTVLRQRGVKFSSRMDSNGYLFDEALTARAKDDWGLEQVQITVDGTENVYNSRKAFVCPEGSPYRRVLRNIGMLLDAGIRVGVRLNMDGDNERDLYILSDELSESFGGRPGFSVHCRVLIENKGEVPYRYTDEERLELAEKARAMWAYLDKKGLAAKSTLNRGITLYSCWSDRTNAATITPDGCLGRCESHIDKGIWGSVFSEERDGDVIGQWLERRPPEERCRTCEFYPRCARLKMCVMHTKRCSPVEREEKRIRLSRAVLGAYEEWKAGGQARADENDAL